MSHRWRLPGTRGRALSVRALGTYRLYPARKGSRRRLGVAPCGPVAPATRADADMGLHMARDRSCWGGGDRVKNKSRFPAAVVSALDAAKVIGLRGGTQSHRFLGVWVVVVGGRAFVRTWNNKPGGWYQVFREESEGRVQVGELEFPVRVRKTWGEQLLDAIDRAYREKYPHAGVAPLRQGLRAAAPEGRDAGATTLVGMVHGSYSTRSRALPRGRARPPRLAGRTTPPKVGVTRVGWETSGALWTEGLRGNVARVSRGAGRSTPLEWLSGQQELTESPAGSGRGSPYAPPSDACKKVFCLANAKRTPSSWVACGGNELRGLAWR